MALAVKNRVDKKTRKNINEKRRIFLKKSVYVAPTLIILGGLFTPQKVKADFGGTPSDASW